LSRSSHFCFCINVSDVWVVMGVAVCVWWEKW